VSTVNEIIAEAYAEFLHQEGARDRWRDFADWLLGHLAEAGYTVVESGHPGHIIDLHADGWTIQHPLACRARGELFSCPFNQAARRLDRTTAPIGRYSVTLDDGWLLIGDRVEPQDGQP